MERNEIHLLIGIQLLILQLINTCYGSCIQWIYKAWSGTIISDYEHIMENYLGLVHFHSMSLTWPLYIFSYEFFDAWLWLQMFFLMKYTIIFFSLLNPLLKVDSKIVYYLKSNDKFQATDSWQRCSLMSKSFAFIFLGLVVLFWWVRMLKLSFKELKFLLTVTISLLSYCWL